MQGIATETNHRKVIKLTTKRPATTKVEFRYPQATTTNAAEKRRTISEQEI